VGSLAYGQQTVGVWSVTDSWQWQLEHFFPHQAKTVTGDGLPLTREVNNWHKGCFEYSADDSIRPKKKPKALKKTGLIP
jgi:hypothetical protein